MPSLEARPGTLDSTRSWRRSRPARHGCEPLPLANWAGAGANRAISRLGLDDHLDHVRALLHGVALGNAFERYAAVGHAAMVDRALGQQVQRIDQFLRDKAQRADQLDLLDESVAK